MGLLKATDILSGKASEPRQKLCSCGCGEPLGPRVDGERQKIGGEEVREDCYYKSFGDGIGDHPIGMPLTRRGG